MPTAITEARIITPDETIESATIVIGDDGRISEVRADATVPPGASRTAATGLAIVPGFIDLHVHGGGGFSLATEDPSQIESYARWVVRHGVTSFLATIFADDLEESLKFVRVAAQPNGTASGGAALLGLHLEGPFVNSDRRGALPESWITDADVRTFDGMVQAAAGHLRMLTLAPELPRSADVLGSAVSRGIVVALGHTDAGYDVALRAFEAGASHVTHAFNAMRPFHHRDPGPVGAALESPHVTVEVVADGVHLHPATIDLLIRALGPERVVLTTDAVTPAGLSAGSFRIGREEARLEDGRMLLPDGTIAGSAATMDQLVRNVVEWRFTNLADAALMASTTPARVIGVSASKGRVAPGFDADLVALDSDLAVAMTWVGGELVYRRGEN
jgi:N-acetylglucosamine-6-phosphate deacetylase